MKRTRRMSVFDEVTAAQRRYLETGDDSSEDEGIDDWCWRYQGGVAQTWATVRDRFLVEWCARRPGTRPWVWWDIDAPREAVITSKDLPRDLAAQRRRLGG